MADRDDSLQIISQDQLPPSVHMGSKIKTWLRRDGIVIVLYVFSTILMSYPLALKLGKPWLALRDADIFMKLWDNWWLQNVAFHEPSLFFTDIQFHPIGQDLSFHSISWTVAFLSWALTTVTDAITAYNLTILIAIFSTAYAAYLLARPFVRYRAAAWLAGAIYSFAPYHIAHSSSHPDLVHLAPIPLAVLLLFVAITRPNILAALGAALVVGLAAFTSLYIMVFTLLTIGPVLIFLLLDKRRWTQRQVWHSVILFGLVSTLLLSIRLVPIFRNTSALIEAIDLKYAAGEDQTDLLSYVLPSHLNPFFARYTEEIASQLGDMGRKWPAYLGIVPLVLTISALTWRKNRKLVFLWFLIGLMFFILSLGPVLRLNGKIYENTVLPAQYLSWFPPIRAIGRPNYFVIGVLLPIAMLAAYGFDRLLIKVEGRRPLQIVLMIMLPGLLLFEYWSGEYQGEIANVNPFYEQLAHEAGDFGIIQLPMGRAPSKRYIFLQTIHQKAIVEGLSGRTPDEAYEYIRDNPLLLHWSSGKPLDCGNQAQQQFASALDELIGDDFRYVIIDHTGPTIPDGFVEYFSGEPFYQDSDLTAFELANARYQPPCEDTFDRVFDLPSPEQPSSISWDQKISLLGYDLPNAGRNSGILPITVYWQALTRMENSYHAYFHLIDPETGALVAQTDIIPRGWSYPTSWWMQGEVVEDTVQIPVENVPPGSYELYIGWYDEESGVRLPPSSDESRPIIDGSILLTIIEM